ncbi:MAG: hypothetical protein JKX94_11620 [Sneathiella sp.]|nr:hypothetical protein [Sneathiella sp.]
MEKLHWGKGRIQILALKEEILMRLVKGHTHSEIYRDLTEAGKLTVSLRTFHRHTSKYKTIIEDQARATDLQILYPNGKNPVQQDHQSSLKKEPFKHQAIPSDNDTDW